MSSHERHITTQEDYDQAWDALDNRGGLSADDIRRELNMPQFEGDIDTAKETQEPESKLHRPSRAMGTTAVMSSAERRAQSLAAHRPQHGEEMRVGLEDGVLPEERPVKVVIAIADDPERQRTYANGRAEVNAAMGWPDKAKDEESR